MSFISEIEGRIKKVLKNGPKTTRQVSDQLKINWVTADKYLNYLESFDVVKSEKQKRKVYYLKEKNNFFQIPLREEQERIIKKIYQVITETEKVTKTQAQKILFEVNKKLKLNLPVGWYKYGPITIMPYSEEHASEHEFSSKEIKFIKETTKEYAKKDNFDLEEYIYRKEENDLYLIKKQIQKEKENVNILLMDLINQVPETVREITTLYARSVMTIGWNHKTRELFNDLWKLIAKHRFQQDLTPFFEYDISTYFDDEAFESELRADIKNLIINYADSKHSQDTLYQTLVKRKK